MKLKTKSPKWIVFLVFIIVASLLIGNHFVRSNLALDGKVKINISSLSQEVMEEYFDSFSGMAKSTDKEKENILIVTSEVPLKETYGAVKVVDAPNYQYFLQYKTEEDRKHALEMFKISNVSVSENKSYKFTNDDLGETASTYNSWGIEAMGLDKANALVETIDNLPEVTVAIIDTGLDMDLMNKYFPDKVDEVYNVLDPDSEMVDEYGHGTHIAGTIAEGTPNNVKIVPIKTSSNGSLYDTDIITAINYVTYYGKADVINMSFGGSGYTETTEATRVAIEAAREKGIISVAAAGNEATSEISYPSGFDNTISVSAIDSSLSLADYSNFGKVITFAAPGTDIKSIMGNDAVLSGNSDGDDDFETISGTSMATPHVVSAVAMLKSINPELGFNEVIDVLKDHTIDLGAKGWDSLYGYGLISFDGIKLCDRASSSDCDAYSVFEKFVPNGIEIDEVVLTPYNYGSITNILATTVSISSTNGESIKKKIGDFNIDDFEISGYDPYSSEEQTVTLYYSGLEVDFTVKNPNEYVFGWEYSVGATGYTLIGYKDHNLGIKTLYLPNTLDDGTPIVALNNYANQCVFGIYSNEMGRCINSVDALNYSTIVLPENIKQIEGKLTLAGSLSGEVTLPNLERIVSSADELKLSGGSVLAGLKKLYSVEANILLGGGAAFWGDELLSDVTLSENNTIIPSSTFRNCKNLLEITIPDSVEEIGDFVFSGASINELFIPKNVRNIGIGMLESTNQLALITVSEDNSWYYSPEGSNAIIQTENNKLVAGSSSTVIPDTVKIIGEGALLDIYVGSLEINIPEGITTIENNSIYATDIATIVLPNSLESIDDEAFSGINHGCSGRIGECSFYPFAFWVHRDSYAHGWVVDEEYGYVIIEELDENRRSMFIGWEDLTTSAHALDTINSDNTELNVYYVRKDGTYDPNPVRANILRVEYGEDLEGNSTDHLIAGWNGFRVIYDVDAYHNVLSTWFIMEIPKRIPEYTLPTGLEADPGQRLSEIALPDGFSWKYPDTILNGAGTLYYSATFTPEDTENYEIVEVLIGVYIRTDKILIKPTFRLNESVLISDDPLPITQEEIEINGFEPIEGDGVGYEVTFFEHYYDDEEEKIYITLALRMSDRQFESHYFPGLYSGGNQESEFRIEADAAYSSNPFIGAYDGEEHSISFNLGERYSQCTITYSDSDNGQYDLTELPVFVDAGTYNVYYRVDCGGSHSFTGSNTVMITGFKIDEAILRGDKLRVVSNELEDLLDAIEIIGDEEAIFRILDGDGEEIEANESTTLATGYTLEIQMGSEVYDFEIALVGDLTGDGLVDERDFEAMRQHLIGAELLKGVYLLAGDISDDGKINSGDLLRLKQQLLSIKLIKKVAASPALAIVDLSASNSKVYVEDTFTVTLSIDTVAAWNIHISSDGPVDSCALVDVNTTSDALNAEKDFVIECQAIDAGEITVSLSGDYTTADGTTVDLSEDLIIAVDEKSNEDPDDDPDDDPNEDPVLVPDTGFFPGLFEGALGNIPILIMIIGVSFVGYMVYNGRRELFHRVKFNKK